jgi:hypothetical protein
MEQLQFALAPSRFVAAVCSRRAGKTTVCAIKAFQELLTKPNSIGMYLALTDRSVEDIFMPVVRPLVVKYKIKCRINTDEVIFDNGSKLIICGANHPNKIETFRGIKLLFCIIDEAASFNERILHYLIDEVIGPALSDNQGQLMLIGTPAAHCTGTFYNITTGKEGSDVWLTKRWTAFDNPFMKTQFDAEVELFLRRKRCDRTHPKFRREYMGEWCADDETLMIRHFTAEHPELPYNREEWRTVIGVDFGFNDETSFSVIGWRYNLPKAYVLEAFGVTKSSVTTIAHHLQRLKTQYNPISIVGDPAGASKIIMEEFSKRYHINLKSAQKQDKAHYIELLSDALFNQDLVLVPGITNNLQEELRKLVWNEERTREQEGVKCDQFDATLYCYREARAYLEKVPVPKKVDPNQWEKDMLETAKKNYQTRENAKLGDPFFVQVRKFLGETK